MVVKQKEAKFFRSGTGQKKLAPINMRKEEHQFVIDGYLIDEVLKQIPAGIKIIQASVGLIKREADNRIAVPNVLKKLGVSQMRNGGARRSCFIVFDSVSKATIQNNVGQICEKLSLPYQKAYFQYIVLANGDASCRFNHCTKEIRPDDLDQRKKMRVLGATTAQGRVQGLLADISAKKYHCTIKEETVKMVMCSRD